VRRSSWPGAGKQYDPNQDFLEEGLVRAEDERTGFVSLTAACDAVSILSGGLTLIGKGADLQSAAPSGACGIVPHTRRHAY
jgi:hypothetical protein